MISNRLIISCTFRHVGYRQVMLGIVHRTRWRGSGIRLAECQLASATGARRSRRSGATVPSNHRGRRGPGVFADLLANRTELVSQGSENLPLLGRHVPRADPRQRRVLGKCMDLIPQRPVLLLDRCGDRLDLRL